ncbi:MAG TPA: hypothetical protein VME69_08950 [Methylocella sp.]|nr:hypothetical protein [Methylocella sp.]
MIDLDAKTSTQVFIDVLRAEIAELEQLEARGESTADTCEMLVDLHEFVERLTIMYSAHGRRTSH